MYHVDNSTGVPVMPQPSPVTSETELFFTEGGNGVPPTFPGPDWFNIIQSELINILRAAGLDPDKMDNTQILAALKKLFLSRSNPFGDIKADGAAAIATALSNLDLGTAAKKDVGTGAGQIPDMSSFTYAGASNVFTSIVIAGNRRIMEGSSSGSFVNGVLNFTLPLAYPSAGFTFIPTDTGSGVVSYAAIPKSGSVVTIYGKDANGNMLNASYGFKYIAMGSA